MPLNFQQLKLAHKRQRNYNKTAKRYLSFNLLFFIIFGRKKSGTEMEVKLLPFLKDIS